MEGKIVFIGLMFRWPYNLCVGVVAIVLKYALFDAGPASLMVWGFL